MAEIEYFIDPEEHQFKKFDSIADVIKLIINLRISSHYYQENCKIKVKIK